jgi:hypothetical protein
MVRLGISVLFYTLVNTEKLVADQQCAEILGELFDLAVRSHRTNILSKESSRMLARLVKENPASATLLARHVTATMLTNISPTHYLNNVREVI